MTVGTQASGRLNLPHQKRDLTPCFESSTARHAGVALLDSWGIGSQVAPLDFPFSLLVYIFSSGIIIKSQFLQLSTFPGLNNKLSDHPAPERGLQISKHVSIFMESLGVKNVFPHNLLKVL